MTFLISSNRGCIVNGEWFGIREERERERENEIVWDVV